VLKHVQPHEISFSTSIAKRISWVDVCNNMKTSCVLHVNNNYGVIFFAINKAAAITDHINKQQQTSVEACSTT
jgi:hypothetical protein